MATKAPSSPTGVDVYDVYVARAEPDVAAARWLTQALAGLGLRTWIGAGIPSSESDEDASAAALDTSRALVVLWSPASVQSVLLRRDIERFVARHGRDGLMVPVVLGPEELLRTVPPVLGDRQAIVLGPEATGGPSAAPERWNRLVEELVALIPPREAAFSDGALRALTYASTMLSGTPAEDPQRRTAALLGALIESAAHNMTPTTGDVMRMIEERQEGTRDAFTTLNDAARAAGLTVVTPGMQPGSVEQLLASPAGPVLREAAEAQFHSGADRVHLRHVLAPGVQDAVLPAALEQLRVSLDDIRATWRDSLARTWPSEDWSAFFAETAGAAPTPPTARVQTDRWTLEDALNYALYARAIASFITHENAEPPMVISVQGPWGQGKTSLMRMIQERLDPDHPDLPEGQRASAAAGDDDTSATTFGKLEHALAQEPEVQGTNRPDVPTVWFNAWKYQSSEQIWAGLAHAILEQLPARLSRRDREAFWLRLQRKRIDPGAVRADIHKAALEKFVPWMMMAVVPVLAVILGGIVVLVEGDHATGATVSGIGAVLGAAAGPLAWLRARGDVLRRPLEGAYLRYVQQPDYTGKLGYLHLVEEDMKKALQLLAPDKKPVVIFIDDLDRCSPSIVGEVIEAVNLFLAGEYPNCAFVIGIDAEVVAASMEVLHADIIGKLGGRSGELGWRFMDKFVQLPFVMPRLQPDQRKSYLSGLFDTPKDVDAGAVVAEAEQLKAEVEQGELPADVLAQRVGELAPRLAAVDAKSARDLGEQVVALGADKFSDNDPEVKQALAAQLDYLSDNPRTIKRAVNLYRFHRFAAFARQASTQKLAVATPEQIGRWIVVIIRWPHFVRWLQTQREQGDRDPAARVLELAHGAKTHENFLGAAGVARIDASWVLEEELWDFLHSETPPELSLDKAAACGLW